MKRILPLVACVLALAGFFWYFYVIWAHRAETGRMLLAFQKAHPFSPIDMALGAVGGFITALMIMLFVIAWPLRKELDDEDGEDNGPRGGGGGPKRRIPVPFTGKVVSIEEFRKMPTPDLRMAVETRQ